MAARLPWEAIVAGERVKEVLKMGGLNLRQEPADLEDHALVKVSNFDPYRAPGTLTVRRGRELLSQTSLIAAIRQISKVNGFRYQVAGQTLYRNNVAITGGILDDSLETNFVGFRPLNDSVIWAFVADDALMLKDDGTRTYLWGLDKVPVPAPKVANQTGKTSGDTITAGDYTIAVTQIRWDNS